MSPPTTQEQIRFILEFSHKANISTLNFPKTQLISPPTGLHHSTLHTHRTGRTSSGSKMDIDKDPSVSQSRSNQESALALPANTPSKPKAMRDFEARNSSRISPSLSRENRSRVYMDRRTREASPTRSSSPRVKRRKEDDSSTKARERVQERPRSRGKSSEYASSRSQSQSQSLTPRNTRELFPQHISKGSVDTILSAGSTKKGFISRSRSRSQSRSVSISPEKEDKSEGRGLKCPMMLSMPMDGDREMVCYNCMQKGHWFMDCVAHCGKCGGDGHKTISCPTIGTKAAAVTS